MEIGLSLLPGLHSGMHFIKTFGCVPPGSIKTSIKTFFLKRLQGITGDIYYLRFVSMIYIDFLFITSLYQLCQSLVLVLVVIVVVVLIPTTYSVYDNRHNTTSK